MMLRLARTATVALVALGSCGRPKVEACQTRCAAGGPCPGDLVCGADLYCHQADDTSACSEPDVDAADDEVDAAVCAEDGDTCDDGTTCFEGVCDGAAFVAVTEGCALRRSGSLLCWGVNDHERAGVSVADSDACPAPCVWEPRRIEGLPPVTDVVTGRNDLTCAIAGGGELWCWGANDYSQLGHDPATDADLCNVTHACRAEPERVEGIPPVDQVSVQRSTVCALAGGAVHCWGSNSTGLLGEPVGGTSFLPVVINALPGDVVEIAVGSGGTEGANAFACARTAGGLVYCWGANRVGQLGHDPATDDDCGGIQCTPTPELVKLGSEDLVAVEIEAGSEEVMCARQANGTVYCWGNGAYGQLDDAHVASSSFAPIAIAGLPVVRQLSAGSVSTCALVEDADGVYCWGTNPSGQLGDGTITGDNTCSTYPCDTTPHSASSLAAIRVVVGVNLAHAIGTDGQIYVWGNNQGAGLAHEPATGDDVECNGAGLWCDPTPKPVAGLP